MQSQISLCTGSRLEKNYLFAYSCLPNGFKVKKDKDCDCNATPPPPGGPKGPGAPPPPAIFCANLPYILCEEQKDCESRFGIACGNLQYTFCRRKDPCPNNNTCAIEPASGIAYFFKECIPTNWTFFTTGTTTRCDCGSTTTNKCPHCPPGYGCKEDGPLDSSNCITIERVPILPPEPMKR